MSLKELLNQQIQHMNSNNNNTNERFNTVRQSSLTPPEKRYINVELNNLYTDAENKTTHAEIQTIDSTTFQNKDTHNENKENEEKIDTEETNNINYYCIFGGSTIITLVCIVINNFLIYNFTDIKLKS
jgi:hypothetical protein